MAKKNRLKIKDVETFERLNQQLSQLHEDINALSKKSPDNPINKFKLAIINEKLSVANSLLSEDFMPIEGFTQFNEADLPSNSDVVLILSQYLEALEAWRSANIVYVSNDYFWDTEQEAQIVSDDPSSNYRARRKN